MGGLSKKGTLDLRLCTVLSLTPAENQFKMLHRQKILNWFIFNFRNKLINVTAGASVDVCRPFKLTDSIHDYRRFELVIFPEQWRRSPWVVTLVVNTPTFLNCHLYKFVSYLKKRERASNSSLHCLHKNLVFLFAKTVVESRQAMVSNLLVLPQNGKVWH